jgi:hypothetical protein
MYLCNENSDSAVRVTEKEIYVCNANSVITVSFRIFFFAFVDSLAIFLGNCKNVL